MESHNKLEDVDKDFSQEYVVQLAQEIDQELGQRKDNEDHIAKLAVSFQNHINKAILIINAFPEGPARQSIRDKLQRLFEEEEKVGFVPLLRVGIKT